MAVWLAMARNGQGDQTLFSWLEHFCEIERGVTSSNLTSPAGGDDRQLLPALVATAGSSFSCLPAVREARVEA